jgi:hypothetical protein
MRYIAVLAIVLLSACSMFSKNTEDFSCPKIGFIGDADVLSLAAGEAQINGFKASCSFSKNPDQVQVELTLPFKAQKEEKAADKSLTLPYFIAVLSPTEEILQRQALSTKVDFDNTGIGSSSEEHTIKIPLTSPAEAYKYKVVIGFVLTPEQLKQNKEKK